MDSFFCLIGNFVPMKQKALRAGCAERIAKAMVDGAEQY